MRRPDGPGAILWLWDRRRRHRRILQGVRARRQRRELIGYFFQIRLLNCGTLRELLQRRGVLLLCQLNILQRRTDDGIWYWR